MVIGEMTDFGVCIFITILSLILLCVFLELMNPRKTKRYRQVLADLYVAAKIRFLAKEDGLNIEEEYESFKKWNKKQRIEYEDLDKTVEVELQERVAEPAKKEKKEHTKKE